MGNTNIDGIWTPDEDDTMEADVYLPMMAESISQGLGKRMKLQETRVSLRATTPVPFNVDSTVAGSVQVPLTIAANVGARGIEPDYSGGNHASGILIEGDYAKIVTPGLYTIIGQITIHSDTVGGGTYPNHSWDFYGSINGQVLGLPTYGATNGISYTFGVVSDTRFLAKDDMISLNVAVGTDHVGAFAVQDALLTLSMQYAVPEA